MNTGAHVIRTQCLRQRTELLLDADGRVRPRRASPGIDLLMQLPRRLVEHEHAGVPCSAGAYGRGAVGAHTEGCQQRRAGNQDRQR